ncbi:cytochrome P450 [Methylogaea oryzae]|uniref:cytochrome P450 n=1 Tax=Methylogaea oryzae TaxID=1295382 RepID=UPI0009E827C1|nr:cytochrome P450 [Methylogaea oryzae]
MSAPGPLLRPDGQALGDGARTGGGRAEQRIGLLGVFARSRRSPPHVRRQIRDNLLTLSFAGHDTTASALAWGMYWTHVEPGVLAALLDELGDYAKTLDTGLLKRTPYLDAVCWETLRIHPIAPGSIRRLARAMELGGYVVPEDSLVMASTDLVSADPSIYPDPERFRPERFLERNYGPDELIPFGGGERRCPGAAMAFMEMRVVLATLLCRYEFRLCETRPVKPAWANGIRQPETGVRIRMEGLRDTGRPRANADPIAS